MQLINMPACVCGCLYICMFVYNVLLTIKVKISNES